MAATAKLYGLALQSIATKKMDLSADTMKVMLCTSAYAPNQDTHQFQSSVTNEVAGTGYTAGGAVLTSQALSYNAATHALSFSAATVTWANSTLTARYAVIYDATPGSAAANPLLAYVDFGADTSSTASAFTITWNASGIAILTAQ